MRKIKQLLEDFIVREISDIELNDSGKYSYFILKKRNYNILSAIKTIAKKLKINEKNIGFAGNKDKNAVTEQFISIKDGSKNIENMQLKDIGLKYVGKGNEEIYLGRLKGNEFIITIRNLTKEDIKKINDKPSPARCNSSGRPARKTLISVPIGASVRSITWSTAKTDGFARLSRRGNMTSSSASGRSTTRCSPRSRCRGGKTHR